MKGEHTEIIDLSHLLLHDNETRTFQIKPQLVDFTPRVSNPEAPPKIKPLTFEEISRDDTPQGYYVLMHELLFHTNAGTHMEVPRHCLKNGPDLSEIPLEQLIGEAVILDLRACRPQSQVSVKQIQNAATESGGINRGDIVFCMFGHDVFYKTDKYKRCPYFSLESIRWLVQKRINVLGVDTPEIDSPEATHPVNHLPLFEANIPLIENLTNLTEIKQTRVNVFILPVKIKFLDAFPVRVIALK